MFQPVGAPIGSWREGCSKDIILFIRYIHVYDVYVDNTRNTFVYTVCIYVSEIASTAPLGLGFGLSSGLPSAAPVHWRLLFPTLQKQATARLFKGRGLCPGTSHHANTHLGVRVRVISWSQLSYSLPSTLRTVPKVWSCESLELLVCS